MSWEDAEGKAKEYGTGLFIKLKDGDSIVGTFVGEPEARETVWLDGKTFDFDENNPEHAGVRKSLKLRFNFYVIEQAQMKILEVNQTTFADIVRQKKKRNGLEGKVFELARTGSGAQDTKYHLDFERDCSAAELEAIGALDVLDLQPRAEGDGGSKPEGNAPAGNDHSNEFVDEIKSRLRQLDRSKVTEFLANFEISKVKDLAESQFAAADAYVSNLEAERDGGGVDPFAD